LAKPSTSSGNEYEQLPELVEGNTKMGTTQMNTAIFIAFLRLMRYGVIVLIY
jgi:hypothetical protein